MKENRKTTKQVSEMLDALRYDIEKRQQYDRNMAENERWFRMQEVYAQGETEAQPPSTGFLFNVILNKHADAMDAYPEPIILEREPHDTEQAQLLSKIVPAELALCGFKRTYAACWWDKLKYGTAVYGVFYNPTASDGVGDLEILPVDLRRVYFEPGITDIQKSKYVFLLNYMDRETLEQLYPKQDFAKIARRGVVTPFSDGEEDAQDKYLVIDCYYKTRNSAGQQVVHLCKIVGDQCVDSTEWDETTKERGLYDHGMYPLVVDALYPEQGSPLGFGMIDIVKNPQLYIDKLDAIISKNALIAGKQRWLVKDTGGINEDELLDMASDVVHTAGGVSEDNVRQFQAKALDPFIMTHRQCKINELKEIAGNRDVQQGGSFQGVTAYRAIALMQEAGNKTSRDMISQSYEVFKEIVCLSIEVIRQFFTADRNYRIAGADGTEYVTFNNQKIKAYTAQNPYYAGLVKPMFDIDVKVQKTNAFNLLSQNEFILTLYDKGFFSDAHIEEALMATELMSFEGKNKLVQMLNDRKAAIASA